MLYPPDFNGLFGLPVRLINEHENAVLRRLLAGEVLHVEHKEREAFEKYLLTYEIKVTRRVIDFILSLDEIDSTGKVVLWCYTLRVISRQLNVNETMEIDDVTLNFRGIPTEEAYHAAWEKQKIKPEDKDKSENFLDYAHAWKTVIPESKPDETTGKATKDKTEEPKKAVPQSE